MDNIMNRWTENDEITTINNIFSKTSKMCETTKKCVKDDSVQKFVIANEERDKEVTRIML